MQRLIDGARRFRAEMFGRYSGLFQRLSREGQKPHTLFITCADSRVLAELITHSQPGDLFVVKNVGNIVPPDSVTGSTNSTAAAIEFAVQVLEVSDIVVCGHSQCGAMEALLKGPCQDGPSAEEAMPHLWSWLSLAEPVRCLIENKYGHLDSEEARLTAAAEENVLFALENLQSYSGVRKRLEEGRLHLHGWMFKIATAELFAYDPVRTQFARLE